MTTEQLTTEQRSEIENGISVYTHERKTLLRLLRRRGSFSSAEFDSWLTGREFRRPLKLHGGICGDSYLLGMGANGGNEWARWLHLIQYMMILGEVDAETIDGLVVYSLFIAK